MESDCEIWEEWQEGEVIEIMTGGRKRKGKGNMRKGKSRNQLLNGDFCFCEDRGGYRELEEGRERDNWR
jgi:hypothetical protein